jgi:hypothetical protein
VSDISRHGRLLFPNVTQLVSNVGPKLEEIGIEFDSMRVRFFFFVLFLVNSTNEDTKYILAGVSEVGDDGQACGFQSTWLVFGTGGGDAEEERESRMTTSEHLLVPWCG